MADFASRHQNGRFCGAYFVSDFSRIFVVYHHFINPSWLDFILDYERETMLQSGLGAGELAARLDAVRVGNSDLAQIVGGFIGTIVLGLIISLVISLFLRKRPA
jgi:hypothetical protein